MIRLSDLLNEDVSDDAKRRGLHHIGWGRYANKSGKFVAKNVDGKLVDVPKKSREELPLPGSPEAKSAPPEVRQHYKARRPGHGSWQSRDVGARPVDVGSELERRWRTLVPGGVDYDADYNSYVARNQHGHFATFKNDAIAVAYAGGHMLKGYDFENDYDNSMEKLKQELQPYLKKLKSRTTSATRKAKIKNFIKDLFTAFVDGVTGGGGGYSGGYSGGGSSGGGFGGFGGGGGFSGGGSSGRF